MQVGIRIISLVAAFAVAHGARETAVSQHAAATSPTPNVEATQARFLDEYCSRCHNDERLAGDWSLSTVQTTDVRAGAHLAQWEKILRMTRRGEMPPKSRPQPSAEDRGRFIDWLETSL